MELELDFIVDTIVCASDGAQMLTQTQTSIQAVYFCGDHARYRIADGYTSPVSNLLHCRWNIDTLTSL